MMQEFIRQAATVILIRDFNGKLQIYMTQRPESMIFLPGYHVFPGGAMEPEDKNPSIQRLCVNDRIGVDLSYAITAIRECFEEVGYLLGEVPEDHMDTVPKDTVLKDSVSDELQPLQRFRKQMASGEFSFHQWIVERQIRLRTDKMRYFGHRITPRAISPRRFDTRYFLTAVPPSVELEPSPVEVAQAAWLEPSVALEMFQKGIIRMVPPTRDAIACLANYRSTDEALAKAQGVGTPRPHELA